MRHMHMLITAVKTRQGECDSRNDHVAGPGKGSGCSCTARPKASRRISQLGAMRQHASWALFATFFFTAVGMFSIPAQVGRILG